MKQMPLTDRLEMAQSLSAGKRVLDIGASWALRAEISHDDFGSMYRGIPDGAREYMVVDRHASDFPTRIVDLNDKRGLMDFEGIVSEYDPEVILCMETLEHLNYPCEIMDIFSSHLERSGGSLFITIPNNANWLWNALGMDGGDHNYAFFKSMALNFVCRSRLGRQNVTVVPCIGKYKWYWRLFYLASLLQPVSWGFLITAPKNADVTATAK